MMNSRAHGVPSSGWGPHITTPLCESAVAHNSKFERGNDETGHFRQIDTLPTRPMSLRVTLGRPCP
jgi:hypothetical protein